MATEIIDLGSDDDEAPSTTLRPLPQSRPPGSAVTRHVDRAASRKVGHGQSEAVDLTESPQRNKSNIVQQTASVNRSGLAEASGQRGEKRPLDPSHVSYGPVVKRPRTTVSLSVSTKLPARASKSIGRSSNKTIDLTLDDDPPVVKGIMPKSLTASQPQVQLPRHPVRDQTRRHEGASDTLDSSPRRLLADATSNATKTRRVAKSPSRKPLGDVRMLDSINTDNANAATAGRPKAHATQKPKNNVTASKSPRYIAKSSVRGGIPTPLVLQPRQSAKTSQRRSSPAEDIERRSTVPESPPISPTGFHEQRRTPIRVAAPSGTDYEQLASTAAETHVKPTSEGNNLASKAHLATGSIEGRVHSNTGRSLQPQAMSQKVGARRQPESSDASSMQRGSDVQETSGKDRSLTGNALMRPAEKAPRPLSSFEVRDNIATNPPAPTTEVNGDHRAGVKPGLFEAPTPKRNPSTTPAETGREEQKSARKSRSPSRRVATILSGSIPTEPRSESDSINQPEKLGSMKKASIEAAMVHDSLKDVERIVGQHIAEMRSDNEYMARIQLHRARHAVKRREVQNSAPPTSAFRDLAPILLSPAQSTETQFDDTVKFSVERLPGSKNAARTTHSMRCSVYRTAAKDVPQYSHYVGLKHSLLASNETVLHVWPYFHDDFDMMRDAPDLHKAYQIDVEDRECKLMRMGQAEGFMEYADDMLCRIGCQWADVLRFMLEQNPCPNTNEHPALAQAIVERNKHMEDLKPNTDHWARILSSLRPSRPEQLLKAALLCDQFQRIARYPLWHVARRIPFVQDLAKSHVTGDANLSRDIDSFTCRVCVKVNCSSHGEIRETPIDGDARSEDEDVEPPTNVNFRYRVPLPATIDTTTSEGPSGDCKTVEYWQKGSMALLAKNMTPDQRGPFYPCHHPGTSCDQANCSCFNLKLPCEKICACSNECARRFQGCQCSSERIRKGQKLVCYEDDRCTCFQLGRECDPDLCGDCSVCDVLDPVHRGDDRILQGRCNNASIQRGVAKHTLLGDSGIHGLGLYACEDISKHDFVGEYTGEIVTRNEADRRGAVHKHQKLSYLFTLNTEQDIDGTTFGSKMRFVNHAARKKSNLYPRIVLVNSVHRIALYGQRSIKAGEELFFDYGPEFGEEALGGNSKDVVTTKEKKAAPKTRNSLLVGTFAAVERKRDSVGNLVAMPKTSEGTDGEYEDVDEEGDIPADGGDIDIGEDTWTDTHAVLVAPDLIANNDEDFTPGDESSEARDSDDTMDGEDSPEEMRPPVRARPRRRVRQTTRAMQKQSL